MTAYAALLYNWLRQLQQIDLRLHKLSHTFCNVIAKTTEVVEVTPCPRSRFPNNYVIQTEIDGNFSSITNYITPQKSLQSGLFRLAFLLRNTLLHRSSWLYDCTRCTDPNWLPTRKLTLGRNCVLPHKTKQHSVIQFSYPVRKG